MKKLISLYSIFGLCALSAWSNAFASPELVRETNEISYAINNYCWAHYSAFHASAGALACNSGGNVALAYPGDKDEIAQQCDAQSVDIKGGSAVCRAVAIQVIIWIQSGNYPELQKKIEDAQKKSVAAFQAQLDAYKVQSQNLAGAPTSDSPLVSDSQVEKSATILSVGSTFQPGTGESSARSAR